MEAFQYQRRASQAAYVSLHRLALVGTIVLRSINIQGLSGAAERKAEEGMGELQALIALIPLRDAQSPARSLVFSPRMSSYGLSSSTFLMQWRDHMLSKAELFLRHCLKDVRSNEKLNETLKAIKVLTINEGSEAILFPARGKLLLL